MEGGGVGHRCGAGAPTPHTGTVPNRAAAAAAPSPPAPPQELPSSWRTDPDTWSGLTEAQLLEVDLVFYGVLGIKDPLRQDVKDAVANCHVAGIMVGAPPPPCLPPVRFLVLPSPGGLVVVQCAPRCARRCSSLQCSAAQPSAAPRPALW
jgi:hypothetical protein